MPNTSTEQGPAQESIQRSALGLRLTVATRVIAGLVGVALLAICIGAGSLYYIRQIDRTLNNITDVSAPTVETADDLISGLWESAKVAQTAKSDEVIDNVKRLHQVFDAINETFDKNYIELQELVTNDELLDELRRVKLEHEEFVKHAHDMFAARTEELSEEIIADQHLEEFDNNGARMIAMLDEFAIENEIEMAKAEDRGDELARIGASASEVNAVLGELFERDYPVVEAALKMQRLVMEMQDTAGEYMAEEDIAKLPATRNTFNDLARQATDFISVLTNLAESAEDRQDAADLSAAFNAWVSGADKDEALFDTHRDMLDAERRSDEASAAFESDALIMAESLTIIADKADARSDAADEIAATMVQKANVAVAVGIAIVLALGGALIYMVLNKVTRPITGMTAAMRRLANKEMMVEIPGVGRSDEIGGMADAVQVFKDNMIRADELAEEQRVLAQQKMEEEEQQRQRAIRIEELANDFDASVSNTLNVVSVASQQMESAAQSLTVTANQTLEQSQNVAAASEEASTNVQTVAAATGELSNSITEISRQVTQSSEVSTQAVKEVETTNQEIDLLANAADRISEIIKLITDIAEQTNLLALNATIEAARAGDAGKGFAVVASEVKNLANQTAKGTEDISRQIDGLQGLTKNAVNSVNSIGTTMDKINDIATAISAAVEEQTSATQEISRNIEQAASGTTEVNTNIIEVNQAATETGSAAAQVMESTKKLNEETVAMRSVVETFLSDIKAA